MEQHSNRFSDVLVTSRNPPALFSEAWPTMVWFGQCIPYPTIRLLLLPHHLYHNISFPLFLAGVSLVLRSLPSMSEATEIAEGPEFNEQTAQFGEWFTSAQDTRLSAKIELKDLRSENAGRAAGITILQPPEGRS